MDGPACSAGLTRRARWGVTAGSRFSPVSRSMCLSLLDVTEPCELSRYI